MKKLYAYNIIVIFFVILLLPTAESYLKITSFQTMEDKQPIEAKGRGLRLMKNYVKQINAYYSNNFGGRDAFVYSHNLLNYYIFRQTPIPEQVVFGKEGWLFAGDHSGDVIKQHIGLYPLHKDSALAIAKNLETVSQKLSLKGIKFYVLIAPDSHSIYPEKLPDGLNLCRLNFEENVRKQCPMTPLDVLTETMRQQSTISYIDLRDSLLRKKTTGPLYFKTDTHWNNYGALIGCASLIAKMRIDFPQLIPVLYDEYTYKISTEKGGDLAGLMMLTRQIRERNVYDPERKRPVNVRRIKSAVDPLSNHETIWLMGPDRQQPNLLFFGDSFSLAMMSNLPAYFGRSCFVRQPTLDWQRIDIEKPDAVVVEIVERNLRQLVRL